eukprot:5492661-Prymnesium_polylepis.1
MEYVDSEKFARYCLVPENTISVRNRVFNAIDHLDDSMNEQSMVKSRRSAARMEDDNAYPVDITLDEGLVAFKGYYKRLLEQLRDMFVSEPPAKVPK